MTHLPTAPRAARPSAEYRWTNRKAHAFLDALAQHGKVAAAARAVGMTRQSAYRLRHRVPVVAEGWERAQAIGCARRRGELPKVTMARSQGDTSLPQSDSSCGQGDAFEAQGDAFAIQGDGFAHFAHEPCHTRQHPAALSMPLAPGGAFRKSASR